MSAALDTSFTGSGGMFSLVLGKQGRKLVMEKIRSSQKAHLPLSLRSQF